MRTGLWVSGAGGSGILVGRTADGSWSPPSGIMLHTAGLGFLVGVDIYDCVVVINTQKALDAFSKLRCTLGGEISAVAGPVGAGGVLETEIHKRQAPVFTYMKSRGFYAGVQIDGTIIIERTDENERFYNEKISVGDILAGKVRHPPYECRQLLETIKAAQGDTDIDESMLPSEPPPGDYEIEASNHVFGVPDKEDPDPYGVLALEKEGMSIREAGTHKRASWEQFAFQPAPSSPIYSTYSRASIDRDSKMTRTSARSSWVTNAQQSNGDSTAASSVTTEVKRPSPCSNMTDTSTQTDELPDDARSSRSSVRGSVLSGRRSSMNGIPEDTVAPTSPKPNSLRKIGSGSSHRSSFHHSASRSNSPPQKTSPKPKLHQEAEQGEAEKSFDADGEDTADDMDVVIEEPVIHSVQKATAPQFISKARMVQVPKRVPPKLPPRNPNRRGPIVIGAEQGAERTSEDGSVLSAELSPGLSPESPSLHRSTSQDDDIIDKFENVDISNEKTPEETPGETPGERNPWGTMIAKHNASQESVDMPGAFHSLPPTPGESKEDHKG